MKIGITGATGFLGRYIVEQLAKDRHHCRLWSRKGSDRTGLSPEAEARIEWVDGVLGDAPSAAHLVQGCDAVVHAALDRAGPGFRGAEGDTVQFAETNVVGTLQLIEEARAAGVARFVFVSTCAVHEKILDDRPLDETHPLWPTSHYGAHKAAIEKFVHSYGLGAGYPICAIRPTGIYGVAYPPSQSKWYKLICDVLDGRPVNCQGGGKEVHAADVARAIALLLTTDRPIAGEAYACYDRYISNYEVAALTKEISGSESDITGGRSEPKHQIVTNKLRQLGIEFGGEQLLRATITQLIEFANSDGNV